MQFISLTATYLLYSPAYLFLIEVTYIVPGIFVVIDNITAKSVCESAVLIESISAFIVKDKLSFNLFLLSARSL